MISKNELEQILKVDIKYLSYSQNSYLPYETDKWNLISIYDERIKDYFKFYTGIGSRETPKEILTIMTEFAKIMDKKGYILRSGGANGADLAFEKGANHKEIFLPWKDFNKSTSKLYNINEKSFLIAEKIIPHWNNLSKGAKKLHARNIHQILGLNLDKKSKFVICYTKDGKDVGGTATAIKLARKLNIKIINLGDKIQLENIKKLIQGSYND